MKRCLTFLFALIIGIGIGITIASLEPDFMKPYFPSLVKGKAELFEGKVISKRLEQDKLLLTILTDQGAILVTFNEKISEIDLLIEQGDKITLSLRQYEPFVNNPIIKRVKKEEHPKTVKEPEQSSSDVEDISKKEDHEAGGKDEQKVDMMMYP